jgi:hypothetical protein
LTNKYLIFLLIFLTTLVHGQVPKTDYVKPYEYEVCVYKKGKSGQVLKNSTIGFSDTTVAFISGQVFEKKEPLSFAVVSFTNSIGQIIEVVTDIDGKYRTQLTAGTYKIYYCYLGCKLKIDKIKLVSGQIQELNVDIGIESGYCNYLFSFKKPQSEKDLRRLRKKLSDD